MTIKPCKPKAYGAIKPLCGSTGQPIRCTTPDLAAEYAALLTKGEDPAVAAEIIDATLMPFEEWRAHHRPLS
jgi:hypothetical protein